MRPNPVHQRTSRPECAPGRAPRLRQSEAFGCTGAESGAARPCSIDHSDGRDLRDTPQKKEPAAAGPPPGGSKLTSRPAPLRGAPAAAGAMPPATCRGLPGYLPPPPEVASSPADVRTLEVTRWSGHRQNCVDGYVFDRRKVPRQGRRVRPHMYKAAVILVSPGCTYTHNPAGSELPGGLAGGARQAAR